jgi:hypothetical protein
MSRETIIRLTDDIDGSEAAEELTFALRGTEYEIDLNVKNIAALEKALDKFIAVARKVPRGRGTAKAAKAPARRTDVATIREWAASNGYEISTRGRIPGEIREAYDAAHG